MGQRFGLEKAWESLRDSKNIGKGVPILGTQGTPIFFLSSSGPVDACLPSIFIQIDSKIKAAVKPQTFRGFELALETGTFSQAGGTKDYAVLKCLDPSFIDLFLIFSEEVGEELDYQGVHGGSIRSAIEKWLSFFKRPSDGPLSLEELVGAYGELLLLNDLLEGTIPARKVIDAWRGPLKSDWDFILQAEKKSFLIEVKTTIRPRTLVTVNNVNQLSHKAGYSCYLNFRCVDYIENVEPGPESQNINKLIESLSNQFKSSKDGDLSYAFWDRLELAGILRDHLPNYEDKSFQNLSSTWHIVDEHFPSISRHTLPGEILNRLDNLKYRMNLSGLIAAPHPFVKI